MLLYQTLLLISNAITIWRKANQLKLNPEKTGSPGQEISNAGIESSSHFEWDCFPFTKLGAQLGSSLNF